MGYLTSILVLINAFSLAELHPIRRGSILLVDSRPDGLMNDNIPLSQNSAENRFFNGDCAVGSLKGDGVCSQEFYQCISPGFFIRRRCKEGYLFDIAYKKCTRRSFMSNCREESPALLTLQPHLEVAPVAVSLERTANVVPVNVVRTAKYFPPLPVSFRVLPFVDAFDMPFHSSYVAQSLPSFNTYGLNAVAPDAFDTRGYNMPSWGISPFF